MTLFAVLVVIATATALLRIRLTTARRRTYEAVEALRAELGLPADRCLVVDVSLRESLYVALHPAQRLPRFEDVHRVGDDAR